MFLIKSIYTIFLIFTLTQARSHCISLDTHVHDFGRGKEIKYLLDNNTIVRHFFLISNSYKYQQLLPYDDEQTLKPIFSRYHQDMRVVEAVKAHPDLISGLCSVNLQWSDASDYINSCLKHPQMIGLKLHPSANHYQLINYQKLLDSQLNNLVTSGDLKFLLIHMNLDEAYTQEFKFVIELARKYPRLQVIIAHALGCPDLIAEFTKLKEKEDLSNLYLEVSTTLYPDENLDHQVFCYSKAKNDHQRFSLAKFINALKLFGEDQILYGSDTADISLFSNYASFSKEQNAYYKTDPIFAQKILEDNGRKLLKKMKASFDESTLQCP